MLNWHVESLLTTTRYFGYDTFREKRAYNKDHQMKIPWFFFSNDYLPYRQSAQLTYLTTSSLCTEKINGNESKLCP